jgi:arylsulfatase A-like enzyme
MRKFFIFLFAGCLLAVAAFLLWQPSGSRPRPNILLITLDTTRWDHFSCYGYAKETTPVLDKLAEESVRYEYAISPSSWTLPAHASIFTGVLPTYHGAHLVPADGNVVFGELQINRLDPELPTLAEELKKAGYRTGAIIGGPCLHMAFGVARGFDFYHIEGLHSFEDYEYYRKAHETTSLAVQWLARHRYRDTSPVFLFLNYFDAHSPYHAPEPWGNPEVPDELYDMYSPRYRDILEGTRELSPEERRILVAEYDGEIRYMDSQIGRLFHEMKQLGIYDSTLIVVTSDHGESFGEHGLLGHGRALYEELIRVPLIVKYPLEDDKRGVVQRKVSIMGIMPTILKRAGLPIPETVENGDLDDDNQILIAESYRDVFWTRAYGARFDRDQKAIYSGNFKWTWRSDGAYELFDIAGDPNEENNLREKLPDEGQRFKSQLAPLLRESQQRRSNAPLEVDDNLKKRLKGLGYIE